MKHIKYIFILIVLIGILAPAVQVKAAAIPCTARNTPPGCTDYYLLAPLPCKLGTDAGCVDVGDGKGQLQKFDPMQSNNLGVYLNFMIILFIGICAVMSIVMIVVGGLEYMTSELVHSKEAGKEKIEHALLGLIIALGAWALLNTINPNLLKSDFCTPPQILIDGRCTNPPTTPPPANNNPNFNLGPIPTGGINNTNLPQLVQ